MSSLTCLSHLAELSDALLQIGILVSYTWSRGLASSASMLGRAAFSVCCLLYPSLALRDKHYSFGGDMSIPGYSGCVVQLSSDCMLLVFP